MLFILATMEPKISLWGPNKNAMINCFYMLYMLLHAIYVITMYSTIKNYKWNIQNANEVF